MLFFLQLAFNLLMNPELILLNVVQTKRAHNEREYTKAKPYYDNDMMKRKHMNIGFLGLVDSLTMVSGRWRLSTMSACVLLLHFGYTSKDDIALILLVLARMCDVVTVLVYAKYSQCRQLLIDMNGPNKNYECECIVCVICLGQLATFEVSLYSERYTMHQIPHVTQNNSYITSCCCCWFLFVFVFLFFCALCCCVCMCGLRLVLRAHYSYGCRRFVRSFVVTM